MAEQLGLTLDGPPRCDMCGEHHEGPPRPTCGYDPETVKPAMSITEALSATVRHVIDTHGWDEARRRLPGLRTWDELSDEERDAHLYGAHQSRPAKPRKRAKR